jgi:hypothetical protein
MVKEEWSESISGIIDDIGLRISQLLLRDDPVTVVPSAIEDDVMVLKEVLQNACDDYSDKYRAQDDLRHMQKLERRLNKDDGFQSTYRSEVSGTCTRGPLWINKLFTYPVPHAMKRAPEDEHFLSYDDLAMKQTFGFITTERYLPSRQGKTSKNGTKEGQDRDRRVKKKYGGILNQKQHAMASECHICHTPRCIFTLSEGAERKKNVEATHRYLDNTMPLQCGMPLFAIDADDFPLGDEMHVKHALTFGVDITRHYYAANSSLELPAVCIYCGTKNNLVIENMCEEEGLNVRPQCRS